METGASLSPNFDMKYRVREYAGKFWPQYKSFLFWDYFYSHREYPVGFAYGHTEIVNHSFSTLEEAYDFIRKHIAETEHDRDVFHPYPPVGKTPPPMAVKRSASPITALDIG